MGDFDDQEAFRGNTWIDWINEYNYHGTTEAQEASNRLYRTTETEQGEQETHCDHGRVGDEFNNGSHRPADSNVSMHGNGAPMELECIRP